MGDSVGGGGGSGGGGEGGLSGNGGEGFSWGRGGDFRGDGSEILSRGGSDGEGLSWGGSEDEGGGSGVGTYSDCDVGDRPTACSSCSTSGGLSSTTLGSCRRSGCFKLLKVFMFNELFTLLVSVIIF